jgi:hypothetical protein
MTVPPTRTIAAHHIVHQRRRRTSTKIMSDGLPKRR